MGNPKATRLPAEIIPALARRYRAVRQTSERLCAPLSPEDTTVQSAWFASPAKWHLAHTTWFFETFVLERERADYTHFHPDYRVMFNSYYNSVGEQFSRSNRGLVTRPGLKQVVEYRRYVDEQMDAWLAQDLTDHQAWVLELGLNHEQQHQELMLMDIKHAFSFNPLHPAYDACPESPKQGDESAASWHEFGGDVFSFGHDGKGFAFDNEGPLHRALVDEFSLASRLVTNREFLEFMNDGGYRRPELWLSDAWDAVRSESWQAPLYWAQQDGQWHTLTLGGWRAVREDEPVSHVSYYEADAYATWADARLPTEHEWELAAEGSASVGSFMEDGYLHPCPATPDDDSAPAQMLGDLWEWTRSPYGPYPGYQPDAGAFGEYNGKFMCNQMVLRGGSCVTSRDHIRDTYRNFFPPELRWQFAGIRLARDAGE